jgi:hypothetical protein
LSPEVDIRDYSNYLSDLAEWSESVLGEVLITRPSTYLYGASYAIFEAVNGDGGSTSQRATFADSPLLQAKAVKNQVHENSEEFTNNK